MNDPTLEALWKHALDHWNDDAAHGAFLEYCQRADRLVEAAVRYRGMTGDRDRSQVAEKRLSSVALLALAQLESARSRAPRARSNAGALALIAFFLLGTAGLLAYLLASR
jgi:hypothetical protein